MWIKSVLQKNLRRTLTSSLRVTILRRSSDRTEQASAYSADDALRAPFRGVGRANNDDAGDLRFKCNRDKVGARGGRRFLSLRKPLTSRATTGERAVELTCHSQCWRLHNRLSILSPPSLSLSIFRATAVPRAISSLSLTLSPLVLHSWSTVTASAVHRRRDPAARPWNARSRRRVSPTSAHTSASRICVMCYATVVAPRSRCRPRISLTVHLFLSSLLSSPPPPLSLVSSLCGRTWSGSDFQADNAAGSGTEMSEACVTTFCHDETHREMKLICELICIIVVRGRERRRL